MNNKVLIIGLITGTIGFLFSCAGEHPGFKKTASGIYYKMHVVNESGRAVDTGDILNMDMIYRLKDTTLFDSRMNSQPMMLTLMEKQFEGDIYEALTLMKVGDSATFVLQADSFFLKTAGMRELPPFVTKGSEIFFDVKLNSARSELEIEQERQALIESRKEQEPLELAKYVEENNITVAPRASGLYYIEKEKGNGPAAKPGDRLKAHFVISTINGPQLYSTFDQGQPFEVEVGKEFDNPGVTEAISLMRKGTKATLVVPSEIAFGADGRGEMVPPHTTMIYEIEVTELITKEQYQKQQEQLEKEQNQMNQMNEQNKLREKASILKYLQDNDLKGSPTASGLYYIEKIKGEGAQPKAGQKVRVHYTGKLMDGTKFDSSVDRGQPFVFQLGRGEVIRGWDEGIALMNVGGKAVLVIPSELGYGNQSPTQLIPANSILIFEVELLGIE